MLLDASARITLGWLIYYIWYKNISPDLDLTLLARTLNKTLKEAYETKNTIYKKLF